MRDSAQGAASEKEAGKAGGNAGLTRGVWLKQGGTRVGRLKQVGTRWILIGCMALSYMLGRVGIVWLKQGGTRVGRLKQVGTRWILIGCMALSYMLGRVGIVSVALGKYCT